MGLVPINAYGTYLTKKGEHKQWKFTFLLEEGEPAVLREIKRLAKDKLTRLRPDFQHVMTQRYTEFGNQKNRRVVAGIENLYTLSKPRLLELAEDEFNLDKMSMVDLTTRQIIGLINEELDRELKDNIRDGEVTTDAPDTFEDEMAHAVEAGEGIDGPSEKAQLNAQVLPDDETNTIEDAPEVQAAPPLKKVTKKVAKKTAKKKTTKKAAKKKTAKKATKKAGKKSGSRKSASAEFEI